MTTALSDWAPSHPPGLKQLSPASRHNHLNGVQFVQSASSFANDQPIAVPPGTSTRVPTGIMITTNGRGSRSRNPSIKPGDGPTRLRLTTKAPDVVNGEGRSQKVVEPFVRTTPYILKKFSRSPPSLIVHLHPTHFRFDGQDGSFPYNSEMRIFIQHLRDGTVPHDMVEELLQGGVRFYEGCLIVRIIDHKSVSSQVNAASNNSKEKSMALSLHSYNQHISPSPYVPYPKQNQARPSSTKPNENRQDNQICTDGIRRDEINSQGVPKPTRPRIFTTVLHPTPLSLEAEVALYCLTPDLRSIPRRSVTLSNGHRGSLSLAPPSTPLSVLPSSTVVERGPPAKRPKMMVEPHERLDFEAKLINATAPPLYLEPVDSGVQSMNLLKFLSSPYNSHAPPSPKTRKRTVAELAADEALAAEEERYMLIMDERLDSGASSGSASVKTSADDDGTAASFGPGFARFKTLETIRQQHSERAKLDHERQVQQKRQQQEEEKQKRQILEQRQIHEDRIREDREDKRRFAIHQAQIQAQVAAAQSRRPQSQGNGVSFSAQQPIHMARASQGPQSSPVVRNITPHASSPLANNAMSTQMNSGIPLGMPSSQTAGSPLQAAAGLQQVHTGMVGNSMVASRSQQGQTRHDTPQMAQATPVMSHATPIMRNATPAGRVGQGSPVPPTIIPTPVVSNGIMATPPLPQSMILNAQQQAIAQQQQQQRQQMLFRQGIQQQLNPQQLAQLATQQQVQTQIMLQHRQQQARQIQLQQQQQQQVQQSPQNPMTFPHQQPGFSGGLQSQQIAQLQLAQQQQQQQQQQQNNNINQHMTPVQRTVQAQYASRQALIQRHTVLFRAQADKLRKDYEARYGTQDHWTPEIKQQYLEGENKVRTHVNSFLQYQIKAAQTQAAQTQAAQAAQVQAQGAHMQQQNMMSS